MQLIKQKVLNKKNKIIGFLPDEKYKQSYNLFINREIYNVCKLIKFICKKINFSISNEEIEKEIKEKFSFYWFHYLGTQLKYLRSWNKVFNDLEIVLIFMQVANLFVSITKEKNLSSSDVLEDPSIHKDFKKASISATSVSEASGIPRATCVRKLEILVRLKIVSQDNISKRYYIIPSAFSEGFISQKNLEDVVKFFSEFYFICIKAIRSKI